MQLGAFSVSLAVKDLATSRQFYEALGFEVVGGDETHNYLILRNATTTIGLFEGMFDRNILTFNPGWNEQGESLADFEDIRDIQRTLEDAGVAFTSKVDDNHTGPASFVIEDPDGNPILVDQHV